MRDDIEKDSEAEAPAHRNVSSLAWLIGIVASLLLALIASHGPRNSVHHRGIQALSLSSAGVPAIPLPHI